METYRSVTWASSCSSPTRSKGAAPAVSLVSAGWKTHSVAEEAKASMQSADWPEDSVTQLVSFTQSILLADNCPTTTQALSTLQPPLQLVVSVLSVALTLVLPVLPLLELLEAASGRMAGSKQAAATTSVQDHIFPLTSVGVGADANVDATERELEAKVANTYMWVMWLRIEGAALPWMSQMAGRRSSDG
ncbi:hypothetical protein BBJ28_00018586 [Nothophytophthora sp. Chile5]|nr:hypothetical protein BBJ28_00018586 [Nothophytophthora sp. Chile5]